MYNFSPDFEVEGPDKNGNYSIRPWTFEDSNDKFWGLDPDAKFPQGANINHLHGTKRNRAQNCLRQRKHKRKQFNKLKW